MGKRLDRTPINFDINDRSFSVVPCCWKHRELFEAGYVVLSCSKCVIERRKRWRDEVL